MNTTLKIPPSQEIDNPLLEIAMSDSPQVFVDGVWELIHTAAKSSHVAFHTPVVATVSVNANGTAVPEARCVVLRQVDVADRKLVFHIDWRSPKAAQIRANQNLAFLFYDPASKLQVRLAALAEVRHMDELARERFRRSQPMSRLCYVSPYTPGSVVSLPPTQAGRPTDPETGLENFAVVVAKAHMLDCLYLHHMGNRRAMIDYTAVEPRARWIAP